MAKRKKSTNGVPTPLPCLNGPYQPGITDPQWPIAAPAGVDREGYERDRAGRVNPQGFLTLVALDTIASNRGELKDILRNLSLFTKREMERRPSQSRLPVLTELPDTWRVTITVGLGASLFITPHGDDRFEINSSKPNWLKIMPTVEGDQFDPVTEATDLIVLISSDHPYVNVAIARSLIHGYVDRRLLIRRVEQGFSRPDKREFLRFDDGVDNLSNARERELDHFVYVQEADNEPDWCVNGSYLIWRKIKEHLTHWEDLKQRDQEAMIGRKKGRGEPLSRSCTGLGNLTPVYPDPTDARDGPLTAHIRKVQPRRPGEDFTGIADLERRFLRRGYPFFDNFEGSRDLPCGLLFLAFMRNLRKQFEWPVQMWQTNPHFPQPNTGIDALYANGILTNLAGGYYFCPPAPTNEDDFLASGIFV